MVCFEASGRGRNSGVMGLVVQETRFVTTTTARAASFQNGVVS